MGRKSKIECHPQGKIIVKRLASGDTYSEIVRDFPGITHDDLDYYKENKLDKVLSESPELKTEIAQDIGNTALAEIKSLQARAMDLLRKAEEAGDLKTALLGVREARGCLELLFKAEGRISDQPQITIINNPQWITLRSSIIKALEPYQEAKAAVLHAIE
jgi:hypothetical protein